jgi:hypothetical protein
MRGPARSFLANLTPFPLQAGECFGMVVPTEMAPERHPVSRGARARVTIDASIETKSMRGTD